MTPYKGMLLSVRVLQIMQYVINLDMPTAIETRLYIFMCFVILLLTQELEFPGAI